MNARVEALARADLRARGIGVLPRRRLPDPAPAAVSAHRRPQRRRRARGLAEPDPAASDPVGELHAGAGPARGRGARDARGTALRVVRDGRGHAARRAREGERQLVEFDDLRYGFPGTPRDGFWGVRVSLDAARPAARPGRALRAPAARARLQAALHDLARDARMELAGHRRERLRRAGTWCVPRPPRATRRSASYARSTPRRSVRDAGGRPRRWPTSPPRSRRSLEGCEAVVHLAQIGSERGGTELRGGQRRPHGARRRGRAPRRRCRAS